MCALVVDDPSGRLLVLGGAGTADQEELTGVYRGALAADVLVSEPGGALSAALLVTSRPRVIAAPTAQGAYVAPAPAGYDVMRTGTNGDLAFSGGPSGLELSE
jgi:hypothetical protein